IPYFEMTKSDRFLSSAYNSLAIADKELGDYDSAIKNHQKALKYRRRLNNRIFEAHSLNNIGNVYSEQKKHKEAIDYYNQTLSYDNLFIEHPLFYAKVLTNLAYAKHKLGITEKLPNQFFRALRIRDSLNNVPGIIASKLYLAEYYEDKDKIDSAKTY